MEREKIILPVFGRTGRGKSWPSIEVLQEIHKKNGEIVIYDYTQHNNKYTQMKNPRLIETVVQGATYHVPIFEVTNEGLQDAGYQEIKFCKGNKQDPSALRQAGFFTETLIQTAKEYLESVNVGELASRETSMVITKLDEALMWIQKRADDRVLRGVQGTYKK